MSSPTFRYRQREWALIRRGKRWSIRLTVGGKRAWYSLRTGEIGLATTRAKQKIDDLASGKLEVDRRPAGKVPTFAEVAAIYKAAKVVRDISARNAVSYLFQVVRTVAGIKDVGALRIDVLSGEMGNAWLAKRQGLDSPDRGTLHRVNVSANSALRQARAVFAKRHRAIYAGWKIPAGVDAFCATKMLPEASMRYVPLPAKCLADMDAAAVGLRESDLEMWLVNRSIRLMGLRAGEVAAMKTTWLIEHDGRLSLDVRARPGEWVPKGHQGAVTVPAVLADIFRERLAGGEGHLIRARDERARYDLIYRRHSKWLRAFLPAGRQKTNHELRKEAGSRVAKKLNSWEAAARFLREDIETAKKHYLELLEPVGLEEADL